VEADSFAGQQELTLNHTAVLSSPGRDTVRTLRQTAATLASLLAVFSWLSPNHYLPWASFHGQLAASAAMAILTALVLSDGSREAHRWPWLACLMGAFAAVPWVQHATGLLPFSGDAWLASAYLLGLALTLYIGRRIGQTHGLDTLLERGGLLVLAGALLSMWFALYQWFWLTYLSVFVLDLTAPSTRIVANFGQPNNLALALTLGTIAGAYLYERRRINGPVALLLLLFFGLGVVMSQSRAALVIWAVLSIALAVWSLTGALQRITLPKIALGLGCAACAWFLWPWLLDFRYAIAGEGDERSLAGMVTSGMRPLHWAAMVDAIGRSPWFGYGWNNVAAAQYLVAPDHPVTTELLGDSHNLILDLLVHNGVPLGGAVTLALGYWLVRHMVSARTPGQVIAICVVLATTLGSMVEFPLNYTFFLVPTGLFMGALSAQATWDRAYALPRWLPAALLLSLTAFVTLVTREYLHAEQDIRSLRFEQQRIGKPTPRAYASEGRLLTHFVAFLKLVDTPRGRDNLSPQELEATRAVVMRFPNWSLLSYYAGELALNGQASEAAAVLTRICRTQKMPECELAKVRWEIWGKWDDRIARIPFPPIPQHPG
jgi:hypothetical protein